MQLINSLGLLGLAYFLFRQLSSKKERVMRKVVLIGASSGIGKAIAIQLAKSNSIQLVLVARNMEKLLQVKKECNLENCWAFAADVSNQAEMIQLLEFTRKTLSGIDTLIFSSGVHGISYFQDIQNLENATNQIFQINTIGPILTTQLFLPELQKNASSQIIVISSASGVMAAPSRTLYTASKHAITGFFRALRMEVRKSGVSICHVMPGSVDTEFRASAVDAKSVPDQSTKSRKVMSPEKCASIILNAAQKMKEEVYIPKVYQYAVLFGVLFPRLIEWLAAKKYAKK